MNANEIAVGCPVAARNWILPLWREHVIASCEQAGLTPKFFFVTSRYDKETVKLVNSFPETVSNHCADDQYQEKRSWPAKRLEQMVGLRNILLQNVRRRGPQLFLSLDSDILIHPDLISNLVETYQNFDVAAVGGKTYMTETDTCNASYGVYNARGGYYRKDTQAVRPVDILMAIKLMGPPAYCTDYVFHRLGEDLGWSKEVKKQGYELYFDGRIANKHVMNPARLGVKDKRCGY